MAAIGEERKASAINAGTALKRLVMLTMIALTIATIWIHEAYFFRGPSAQLERLQPFMPWLAPHIATGALALLLGPFQFSTTIRKRSLALHRWLGRAYMAAVLISAPLALCIILRFEAESARWVMGAMAALWLAPPPSRGSPPRTTTWRNTSCGSAAPTFLRSPSRRHVSRLMSFGLASMGRASPISIGCSTSLSHHP